MNQYIFVLVLTIAFYQLCSGQANVPNIPKEEFDCSTALPAAVNCETDPNCLYPDPKNCSRFYQCADQQQNATRKECASNAPYDPLVFNNDTKRCDYQYNYACAAPPENEEPVETTPQEDDETTTPEPEPTEAEEAPEQTTAAPQTQPPTTAAPVEETTAPPQQPTTEAPGEETPVCPQVLANPCLSPEAQSNLTAGCPAPRNCMFPNATYCQGFIQCQANGANPIPYAMDCAMGHNGVRLYWNDNTLRCVDTLEESTCPTGCPPPEQAPEEPETEAPEPTTVAPTEAPTTAAPTEAAPETPAPTEAAPQPTTEAPQEETTAPPAEPTTPGEESPVCPQVLENPCLSPEAQSNLTAGCPAPRNCMFPNATYCQGFIQCQANGANPIPYAMDCAMGHNGVRLYWNDNTLRCVDTLEESTCPTGCPPPEQAPEEPETEAPEPTTAAPTEAPQTEPSTAAPTEAAPETPAPTEAAPQPTTEAPEEETTAPPPEPTTPGEEAPVCPPALENPCLSPEAQSNLTAGCPAPRNCMFPNQTDCQRFVQCQAGGPAENGVPIAYDMPCAQGHNGQMYWNDNTLRCVETVEESTCSSGCPPEQAPEEPTTGPPDAPTEAPQTEPTPTKESPEETTPPEDDDAPPAPVTTEAPAEETTAPPTSTTTEAPITTAAPTTTTVPTITITTPQPTQPPENEQPVGRVCDSAQAQSNMTAGCPAPRNCMFPNPNTCQGFIQCQPGSPPIQYEMPCAQGHNGQLYWNDKTLTCEEKSNSTCPNARSLLFATK